MKIATLLPLLSILSPVLAQESAAPAATQQENTLSPALKLYCAEVIAIILETQADAIEQEKMSDPMLVFEMSHRILTTVSSSKQLPEICQKYFQAGLALSNAFKEKLASTPDPEQRKLILSEYEAQVKALDEQHNEAYTIIRNALKQESEVHMKQGMQSFFEKNAAKLQSAAGPEEQQNILAEVRRQIAKDLRAKVEAAR